MLKLADSSETEKICFLLLLVQSFFRSVDIDFCKIKEQACTFLSSIYPWPLEIWADWGAGGIVQFM